MDKKEQIAKQINIRTQPFTTQEIEEAISKNSFKNYYTRNEIAQKIRAYAQYRKGYWFKKETKTITKKNPKNTIQ